MSDVKWIKIVTDIFDDEKILLIETLPEADKIIVFLFKLIFKSSKKGSGRLIFKISDKVEITNNVLCTIFRVDEKFIETSMSLFEKLDIVSRGKCSIEIFKFWVPARDRSATDYRKWRMSVFSRDGFTCKKCGVKGGVLNAHHIKEWSKYPPLRFELCNGITLCDKCHKLIRKGGEVS